MPYRDNDLFYRKYMNHKSLKEEILDSMNYRFDNIDLRSDEYSMESYRMHLHGQNESLEDSLRRYGIRNYTIRPDRRTIDVNGNVTFTSFGLERLPFQFGKVSGYFLCDRNRLTTLFGCPKEVGGEFDCSMNQLTTLIGGPREVGGSYVCVENKLSDLKGVAYSITEDLHCSKNNIETLQFLPDHIGGKAYLGDYFMLSDRYPYNYHNQARAERNVHISYMPDYFLHSLYKSKLDIEKVKMDYDVIAGKRKWTLDNIINDRS